MRKSFILKIVFSNCSSLNSSVSQIFGKFCSYITDIVCSTIESQKQTSKKVVSRSKVKIDQLLSLLLHTRQANTTQITTLQKQKSVDKHSLQ